MRRFAVLLGGTAPATAAALTAFFAGLGLGSYLLGRLAPRFAHPLRVFAALEIGTALSALAVEPVLRALQPLYASIYDASADHVTLAIALKTGIAIVAVLVPATCMGGTLPVLAQFVAARAHALGVRVGGLYAVNTAGAALGALAVPAVLLPKFGGGGALTLVAATSAAIGVAVLFVRVAAAPPSEPAARRMAKRDKETLAASSRLPIAAAFVSGVITLALEALAARAFALVHENSAYSFATVVAVFLAGLAGGAAMARMALRRGIPPQSLVVIGWATAGAWIVILPALFVRATGLEYLAAGGLIAHQVHLAVLVAACLLVPSALLGLVLPALMQEAGEGARDGGPAVGAIVGANTVGAILGPPLALFAVAPSTGLWPAVSLLGGVSIAAAAAIAVSASSRASRRILAGAIAVAVLAVFAAPPASLPALKLSAGEHLLDLREGAFGTVAVVERDGHRRIKLNNFYVLGGTASAGDERLQGHIPLLLHPAPQRVAYLGLGTGISLSAVRFHPVQEVVALELVPDVVSTAREWFADANLGVLTDARVRVRAEDARSFVGATGKRFDVVIGDLVVPWRRGESSLYTQESFASVRRVLAPGGLYCQWLPLYQLSEAEFDSIAATFLDVFPHTTLWVAGFNAGEPAVALVGHSDGRLDGGVADRRTRELADLDRANPYLAHPAGLWLYFVGPLDPADGRFRQAPRNRDVSPWVELSSPELHLRIERGEAHAFVGRALKARLDAVSSTPIAASVAASLGAEHLAWRERGTDLRQAALLSFEGDDAAADRIGLATLARLPVEIQIAVTGGPVR